MTAIISVNEDDVFDASKRRLLRAATAAIASLGIPALANARNFWDLPRELWLYRPTTGEQVKTVYWANGQLVPEGYIEICKILRDTKRNVAVQFDIVTLDIARGIYGWLQNYNVDKPLIINSGYRHPMTNASEGGVKNSLHTRAKAIDLRIDGVSTESLTRFAMYLSGGGVGFYPGKNFIHMDRGQIRYWRG
jgi:uncharacterized protein YcbK (DUF882 family)